jgi:hypothetical protein
MISAFGVEHTVSKSYTKLARKLPFGLPKATDTMSDRLRVNYGQWRHGATEDSKVIGEVARGGGPKWAKDPMTVASMKRTGARRKRRAQSQVTAIGNINRRRPDRHLP